MSVNRQLRTLLTVSLTVALILSISISAASARRRYSGRSARWSHGRAVLTPVATPSSPASTTTTAVTTTTTRAATPVLPPSTTTSTTTTQPTPPPASPPGSTSTATTYAGPLVIRAGGTYSGNWESDDPTVPAVSIQTSDPVIIQNCNVRGKYDLIRTAYSHTKVTVQNCNGFGMNPGVAGQAPGRFFFSENFDNATVQNNYLEGTAGIRIATYNGNHTTDTVRILRNRSKNIDGRWSTGTGFSTTGFDRVAFVQLVQDSAIPGAEIAWNEDINEPQNSRVEDNINIYESSGTSTAPILIHDNYIQGAYAALPESQQFSGGGIDTDGASGGTQWVRVYNNQVVGTSNYGLGLVAGANNVFYNNRAISSGLLPNGHQILAQNVGAIDWNMYSYGGFTNNVVRDNVIGWYRPATSALTPSYFPDCPSACTGNTALHGGAAVTLADEAAERVSWDAKVLAAGLTLGSQQ